MKSGDNIRIISGEHRGKTGVVVSEKIIKEVGATEGEVEIGWWLIVLEDDSGTFHESEMEVIEPEQLSGRG